MASRCENCGAASKLAEASHCSYCGTAFPAPETAPDPRYVSVPALLAGLSQHPDYAAWSEHVPSTDNLRRHYLARGLFGLVFTGVSTVILVGHVLVWSSMLGWIGNLLVVVPAAFVALGLTFSFSGFKKAGRLSSMPVRRLEVLVVDARFVPGGPSRSPSQTGHRVTLELADGSRKELRITPELSDSVRRGDYGLAFFRGGHMVDFRRAGIRGA